MKSRLLSVVLALLAFTSSLFAGPRDDQWKKVDEAQQKGLPKTAIEELNPIIADALADQAYGEAIKAIGRKIALEGNIQGNKPEEKIIRLEAEITHAPAAMKPLLEAILANWYWHYFQQNRWRFLQRTQTAETPGTDIQTWDLKRILAEIDRHYTAALADTVTLQVIPVADFNDLLVKGSVPDTYRPTLYDFLAYEALNFYQSGEQGAVQSEDAFELDAGSPIFDDPNAFVQWTPVTTDPASTTLKAVRLYQEMLRFHHADADRSAYHDADLARLVFAHNVAVGDTKTDRYKAALERFIVRTEKHEISARALAALASQINSEGEPAKAHALAQKGLAAFPDTAGGAMCFNLIQQIEAKSAQLTTESVWNAPWPTLDITYRNVTKVYFRAYKVDFHDLLKRARWDLGQTDNDELEKLHSSSPALSWDADLPATADYRERTEKLPVPTTLPPGHYFILASHQPDFRGDNNQINLAHVWVSNLAIVMQFRNDGKQPGGFVLNATSGEPIAGATIRLWQADQNGYFRAEDKTQSDTDGRFTISPADHRPSLILAEAAGQEVASTIFNHWRGSHESQPGTQTVFFTDRAIYRPGQTIKYKGIAIRYDQKHANYETLARKQITVLFRDPNGKEIAKATHTTNDYGSFSGVFTAPRDRVLGNMALVAEGAAIGQTYFSVEEYKRPKFQVALAAPTEATKLTERVSLTGKATAYTGTAIGGAKVKWRVERGVQCPSWCWWWIPQESKAIAHGTTHTEPDGSFKIEFPAEPDRSVPEKNEPVFAFSIHADVTDTTGETRSDTQTVRVGYAALSATLSADAWQSITQPVEFTLTTQTLDGEPQAAEGTVTIHALKQPEKVVRATLQTQNYYWRNGPSADPSADPANPETWGSGASVSQHSFKTDTTGKTSLTLPLKAGIYRASLETQDRFGKKVTTRHTLQVVDTSAKRYGVMLPNHFASPAWSVEPGETFTALWGSGYETGRAFVELERDGQTLKSYWTDAKRTQSLIELPITEEMRGGVALRVTYVRENRAYANQQIIQVPWSNKELAVKWESFRSKLLPGQKETWTARVTGPDAKRATAEMVATLYDASLDQYRPQQWMTQFNVFRRQYGWVNTQMQNRQADFEILYLDGSQSYRHFTWEYLSFPSEIIANLWGYGFGEDKVVLSPFEVNSGGRSEYRAKDTLAGSMISQRSNMPIVAATRVRQQEEIASPDPLSEAVVSDKTITPPPPDLTKVTARKNLNETAFFFPHLLSDEDGVVKLQFTMPEALTQWKFMGFAHDQKLRSGLLTDTIVTAKDLMVEPNPPRFVREGDAIEFTVKVSNQSDKPQSGKVRLTFADAASLAAVDAALGNSAPEQAFELPAKQSRSFSWRIAIPDGMGFLTYKAVGATSALSDGEEGFLPVLSKRILVTESLPLPIRGPATKQFDFKKLSASGATDTLRHQSLTVQMVSQPAWYAVMALPYLMEYPYECSEQLFNRYYANALARHIANSNPKIRRTFDLWKNTPALDSPLAKNEDLKSLMLQETPWLRQANQESEARRNVGLLFDANRLDSEAARTLAQLADRQLSDGLWSWFPGGRSSEYISLTITTGFGRLRHLGVEIDATPAIKSLAGLDAWMERHYHEILRSPQPELYVPSHNDAIYLYARSFFLKDQTIAKEHQPMIEFFLTQSRKYWLSTDCRMCQAQLALALQRFGDKETPLAIMKSLKERSVSSEEMGMFWRDTELSWWWFRAPIETQAMMIEAFDEVAHDAQAVEDCKVWLLKQKQTQDWKTTKATADAIYGLLLHGSNLLASDKLVEVSLGGETIKPEKVEAGTGFYEQKFVRNEIRPAMGEITVKKVDEGVSWGSVHWQYLEDMTKITPHEGTPLKLKKTLWLKETTKAGQVLKLVTGPLAVATNWSSGSSSARTATWSTCI